MQPILNELMHAVAHDTDFLREILATTMKADELIRNLFNIHERILAENESVLVSKAVCFYQLNDDFRGCMQLNQFDAST